MSNTLNLDLTKYILNTLNCITYQNIGHDKHFYSKSRNVRLYFNYRGFEVHYRIGSSYVCALEVCIYRHYSNTSVVTDKEWDVSFRNGKLFPNYRYRGSSGNEYSHLKFHQTEEEHFQYSLLEDSPSWEDISDALSVIDDITKLIMPYATSREAVIAASRDGKGKMDPTSTDYDIRIETRMDLHTVVPLNEIDEALKQLREKVHWHYQH